MSDTHTISTTDERVLKILKTVAIETTGDNDMGGIFCVFCSGNRNYELQFDDIVHESTCETTVARAILKELGMPLHGYRVTFEFLPSGYNWRSYTSYPQAFSEEEVKAQFAGPKWRNIQIEDTKEL